MTPSARAEPPLSRSPVTIARARTMSSVPRHPRSDPRDARLCVSVKSRTSARRVAMTTMPLRGVATPGGTDLARRFRMSMKNALQVENLVAALLHSGFARTFAEELGVEVSRNTPSPLFRLLVFALLASARISHRTATRAAGALAKAGWTTARKMADATWRQRVTVLNRSGYARYGESTSRMLGDTCALLLDAYGGDLRELRERARRDPARERSLLKEMKGIGDVGVDIFFREVQVAWAEVAPFIDRRVERACQRLGLPRDAEALAKLARGRAEFARLCAALVRVDLEDAYDEVRAGLPPGASPHGNSRAS